jgi:hypothetical protein
VFVQLSQAARHAKRSKHSSSLLIAACGVLVCRGRWHSSDVAIKIMSCTRAELARVLREAEVMMQVHVITSLLCYSAVI